MVSLAGGRYIMGSEAGNGYPADGEGPPREVSVDHFQMDAVAVTNARFRRFVRDTGYVTDAERYGWSFVFSGFVSPGTARTVAGSPAETPWWHAVPGAD